MIAFENRDVAEYLLAKKGSLDTFAGLSDSLFYPMASVELNDYVNTDRWFARVTTERLSAIGREIASLEDCSTDTQKQALSTPALDAAFKLTDYHLYENHAITMPQIVRKVLFASPRRSELKRLHDTLYRTMKTINNSSSIQDMWGRNVKSFLVGSRSYRSFGSAIERSGEMILLAPFLGGDLKGFDLDSNSPVQIATGIQQVEMFKAVMDQYFSFLGEDHG